MTLLEMLDALEAEIQALRAKTQELTAVANGTTPSESARRLVSAKPANRRRSSKRKKQANKRAGKQAKQTELALEQTNSSKPEDGEPKAGKRQALGRSLMQLRKSLLDRRAAEAKADEQEPPAT